MLEHLSFSIYYNDKTLDLTCKNENEFDLWVAGCRALFYYYQGLTISKQILLNHSRRFTEKLHMHRPNEATPALSEPSNMKTLEECIIRKPLSREELTLKLTRARDRLSEIR